MINLSENNISRIIRESISSLLNESNHCVICGARIGENNTTGIGAECRAAIKYAKKMTMTDEQKLYYNWIIQANVYKEAFIKAFANTKFKNQFNQNFYQSILNNERISKKQLEIIIDKLRMKLQPNQWNDIYNKIDKLKDEFIENIEVTREQIEMARQIIRKNK